MWLRSFVSVDSPSIFLAINPCRPCLITCVNFSKSGEFSTLFISEIKSATANFFAILTQVTHYLTAVKNNKKIYRLENFRANVLILPIERLHSNGRDRNAQITADFWDINGVVQSVDPIPHYCLNKFSFFQQFISLFRIIFEIQNS